MLEHFYLHTEQPSWFIIFCLLLGGLYSYVLYSKVVPWPVGINRLLAFARFVVVSVLAFLLLGPFVQYITNQVKKPLLVIAIDNSESVALFTDSAKLRSTLQQTAALEKILQGDKYDVTIRNLQKPVSGTLTDLKFNATGTNLDASLNAIATDYEGQNMAGVILLSDGIVNQGKNPVYSTYNFPVYTIGLGDTTQKKDIRISTVLHNAIGYTGNTLPIEAEIEHSGFNGARVEAQLLEAGKILMQKQAAFQNSSSIKVPLSLIAGKPGKHHYIVKVQALPGEFTTLNNTRHLYIDILEGKVNILLAGTAPHPDLKAIKQALETTADTKVDVYLPGIAPLKSQNYQLVILHQLPSVLSNGTEVLAMVKEKQIPALYCIGFQSDLNAFNRMNSGVQVQPQGRFQIDQVTAILNPQFSRFSLADDLTGRFSNYSPVDVPFGQYTLAPGTELVLKQTVGRVPTVKPILAISSQQSGAKNAVLIGEGIWKWRLDEFAAHQNSSAFDKLFQNVAQLLTVKQNKKKLIVYPIKATFAETENISFEAETYNEVYQKTVDQQISLEVKSEKGTVRRFGFVNGENFSRFSLGSLPDGVYTYTASAVLNGKRETDRGEFIVQVQDIEAMGSQADHGLLQQLASTTGGTFYLPEELKKLEEQLLQAEIKPVFATNESIKELINLKWIFLILLGLLTAEWSLRKYFGGY